jgi:hypothetical protein
MSAANKPRKTTARVARIVDSRLSVRTLKLSSSQTAATARKRLKSSAYSY